MMRGGMLGGPARLEAVGDLPDADLLGRYLADRDEAAFAALVARHGPMVLRACRAVLADPDDAADAFQATFLVLARRAGSIRRRDSAASWLHGVARRVAARARARRTRRRLLERQAARPVAAPADGPVDGDGHDHADRADLRALDAEIARLPAALREAVVLCHLEGLTYEAAAGQLGVPEATVRGRLARGRDRLRARLARRGLVVPALPGATVPPRLVAGTLRLAQAGPAGMATAAAASKSVADLATGATRMMTLGRAGWATATILALGLPTAGAFALAQRAPREPARPPAAATTPPAPPATRARSSTATAGPTARRAWAGRAT